MPGHTIRVSGEKIVLVVDDEPQNVELIRWIVEETGLSVRFASANNGLDGVAQARELRPSLVLMDLKMPGLDGLEATRRLKADPATAEIPVVALTAQAMAGDGERALAAGCDGYVTKPIDVRRVMALIQAHLG